MAMEDNQRRQIIILMAGAWFCKPIPIEKVLENSKIKESISCRGGSQSFDKNSISPSLLRKFFPDWEERVNYQIEKTKLCQAAQKKLQSLRPIFPASMHMNLLSPEEKDALDYFRGTGFYAH